MSNTGERIKVARKRARMTARDLGKAINKDRATIYRYEKGDIKDIPFFAIIAIADALQTTPAYLTGQTDDPRSYDARQDEFIDAPLPVDNTGNVDKAKLRADYLKLRMADPKVYQLVNDLADMTIAHQELVFNTASELAKLDRQRLTIDSADLLE